MDEKKVLNFLDLLEKFIDRSERWIADAKERNDSTDQTHYEGQKKVVQEIKEVVSKW